MNRIHLLSVLALLLFTAGVCKPGPKGKYRGKLEIAGICMNYTISLQEGDLDSNLLVSSWTDPNTGNIYSRVFTPANPCAIPSTIKQGDEFYFNIDTSTAPDPCMQCEAFYPTPPRTIRITVTKH